MDEDSSKFHSSKFSTLKNRAVASYYSLDQSSRTKLLGGIVGLLLFVVFISSGSTSGGTIASVQSNNNDFVFDFDEDEGDNPIPTKKKASVAADASQVTKENGSEDLSRPRKVVTNPIDTFITADKFSQIVAPMEALNKQITCPDYNGNKGNKRCGKGFAEYQFKTKGKPGTYFLYIQTLATNIRDNSLWVSPPLSKDGNPARQTAAHQEYVTCATGKPGPLVPTKHIKKKKHVCCPKYLAKNEAAGQNPYYSACCSELLGGGLSGTGNHDGCMLDLEVGNKPVWNLVPRTYTLDGSGNLVVRLYMREDGTIITGLYVSTNSQLAESDIH